MLRAIIRNTDHAAAANIGGPIETRYITVDFDCPEVERWLAAGVPYQSREVVGVEVLIPAAPSTVEAWEDLNSDPGEQGDDKSGQGGG